MIAGLVGWNDDFLIDHRTEPLTVVVRVENIFDDLGYTDLYDRAEQDLNDREHAVDQAVGLSDVDRETRLGELASLRDRLDQLRDADKPRYGEAFTAKVVGERYPSLSVPVNVVVELEWQYPDDAGWGLVDDIESASRNITLLPGSGLAPDEYAAEQLHDLAATERGAGRDPSTRLVRAGDE